ncbi:MAG TPA: proton-conducting transporter membrane subunit [Longimicrobiales bacterium]|nr:proton-conducting transporter membrane subunit [Longimicrobiales bacterium]
MTTVRLLELAGAFFLLGAGGSLALARYRRLTGWVSVVAVGVAATLLLAVAVRAFTTGPEPATPLLPIPALGAALTLRVDGLSALFLCIVAPIAFLATLFSVHHMGLYPHDSLAKYYPALLMLFLAITGTLVTTDFFYFLVFWELMTLNSFFLVTFERENRVSQRAGFKYFVMNQAAALGLLAAALVLWRHGGSFQFDALRRTLGALLTTNPVLGHTVLALFFLGFATKAGTLPMGSWLPDAYPAAPGGASAAFAGAMTKLGLYGLLRVFVHFLPLSGATVAWGAIIAFAGLSSLFVGTLTALKQEDMKRLMSFHCIGQVGYMFFGIGIGLALLQWSPLLGALGLLAGVFHMVNHSLFKSCLFLGAGAVEYRTGTRSLAAVPGGLGSLMAGTAACALVASLAIAGVPPFNGFVSKWLMFATGILGASASFLLPVGVLVAMFISLVTLASFLKYLGGAFLGTSERHSAVREVRWSMLVPQVLLALGCVAFGLAPLFPLTYVHQALASLPSAAALPDLAGLVGAMGGVGVAGTALGGAAATTAGTNAAAAPASGAVVGAVPLAAWSPIPATLVLLLLVLGLYLFQRAAKAPVRLVSVWACGEEEAPDLLRYRAGSFYRPFKEAFRGLYPHIALPRLAFPAALRRALEMDRWLYLPVARGTERAARGFSRTHVGVLQVYLLWIIVGAIAVFALVLLLGGGAT